VWNLTSNLHAGGLETRSRTDGLPFLDLFLVRQEKLVHDKLRIIDHFAKLLIDIMGPMWNLRGNLQIKRGFFEFVENVTSPLSLIVYFSRI
jgi:hypothetical protein